MMTSSSINGMSPINGINAIEQINAMPCINTIPRVASMTDLSECANAMESPDSGERTEDTEDLLASKGKVADFIREHGGTILSVVGILAVIGLVMSPVISLISMSAFVIAAATFGSMILIPGVVGVVLCGCGKMAGS